MSKVKKDNIFKIAAYVITNIIIGFIIFKFLDFQKIRDMTNDFHVNMITASSIIGGFLFTGLGILLGAVSNNRVHRVFSHNYVDVFYITAVMGILSDVASILTALAFICTNLLDKKSDYFLTFEITTFIAGLIAFAISIRYIIFIIRTLKKKDIN